MHRDHGHAIQRPPVTLLAGVVLALTAMFLALVPAPVQADELPHNFDIEAACPEGDVPEAPFEDTTAPHEVAIECLYWYGLALGVSADEYQPERSINRGEAATFLVRLLDRVEGLEMPEPEEGAFTDTANNTHNDNIEQLAGFEPAILRGFSDGRFRPTQPIQRDQFASVMDRAVEAIAQQVDEFASLPDGERGQFGDVPAENVHSASIERLADAGVLLGRTDDRFVPAGTLTRGQSATIIARVLGALVYVGEVQFQRPDDAPAGTVSGVVVDATNAQPNEPGTPIDGAVVEVRGDAARDLTVDADGEYEISLPPGDYTFTVDEADFIPYQQDVELDEDATLELDFRMYRTAQPPAAEDVEASDTQAAHVELRDNFWVIPLVIDGDVVSVQEAEDEIILTRPDGVVFRLGSAGTDASWWNHDGDFTSNRGGDQAGDHVLYYEFDGHDDVDDGWYSLTATFDANGTLIAVNGVECPAAQCAPA
jgi:hypothetical protein